jgi:hypothetical protein
MPVRFERYDWDFIDEALVKATIAGMDRFETRDGRIRAVYALIYKADARRRGFGTRMKCSQR